jgi:hypothetical protein
VIGAEIWAAMAIIPANQLAIEHHREMDRIRFQKEMTCASNQELVFEPEWTQTPPKNIEPASSPVNPLLAALLANLEGAQE